MIDRHVSGGEDLSRQLWGLLSFTLWYERHVEGVRRDAARALVADEAGRAAHRLHRDHLRPDAVEAPERDVSVRLARQAAAMKVWIDMTASAHPLVFRPLVEILEARGDEVEITARDYAQTLQLIESHGMTATPIGHHGGRSRVGKARQLSSRLGALKKWARGRELRRRARARVARADDHGAPARDPELDDVRLRVRLAAAPARLPGGDEGRRARTRSRPSGSRGTAPCRRSSSPTRA